MSETPASSRSLPTSPTLLICIAASAIAALGLFAPSLSPVQATGGESAAYGTDAADTVDAVIEIVDFGFSGTLEVRPGQTIRVVNLDGAPHSLTATDGSFDTGVIDGGADGTFVVPATEGVFAFFCTIHPSMTGELTITS